jgi:ABC-type transport system involved in multi-copper enzyme maturation permease subunit
MITIVMMKELRSILLSPKFIGSFLVASILILLSVYLGINDYSRAQSDFEESKKLTDQELLVRTTYAGTATRASRAPDPMQIFVSGVNNDVGRRSVIVPEDPVKLYGSFYSEETLFALFRYFDLAFIVQVVLSLFAILFTYDSINGEKETGTLQLTFSNNLPRAQFILAKFLGAVLGMLIPIIIPILLGVLLVLVMKVPFAAGDWVRFCGFLGCSVLYIVFFTCLGILMSILTKRSNISFLYSLVAWVLLVFIGPRAASMAAGQMVQVPSAAELDSQRDMYSKDRWDRELKDLAKRMAARMAPVEKSTPDERRDYRDAHEWEWMQQDDSLQKVLQKDIEDYGIKLNEEFRNRKTHQENVTYMISRISPASAFQIAAMNLAQTDVAIKARYEDAMNIFRTKFNQYTEKKQEQSGGGGGMSGGIKITASPAGLKFDVPRQGDRLDFSDAPELVPTNRSLSEIFNSTIVDMGILICSTLVAFGITFFRFRRYEMN